MIPTKILKHTSPAERLAAFLEPLAPSTIAAAGSRAKISPRQLANAIKGRPVATSAFIRLCVATGFDPQPELPQPTPQIGEFDFVMLAMALRMRRGLNGHNVREAGAIMDWSASTVTRMENAHQLSIGFVLKTCRYVGAHPFGYVRGIENIGKYTNVSRETISEAVG